MTEPAESPDFGSSAKQSESVAELADGVEKIAVAAQAEDTPAGANVSQEQQRPKVIYTRKQLVRLSQSPLVKPPDDMPTFKAWFGDWSEQHNASNKKDAEAGNTNGTVRDRRFRREVEEGDGNSRPSFRSALSQPSQMGNFKHQPLRTNNDRDRDTGDLARLSDKFDREKRTVGLPAHSTLIRNRDRDSAPHLPAERDGQQRTGLKKRNGENNDDWRRGDPPRNGRDDPHGRREKDERARQRDSPPLNRRDKDENKKDRERFNDGDDDSRRWREEGRRRRERSRDEDGWTLLEDRRRGGRERDRDDRKDREKEKEPAWMETYVPTSTSAGILGGKGVEGEVDDIQAWKKDMKEREQKTKGVDFEPDVALEPLEPTEGSDRLDPPKPTADGQLDEIQLFKLMMKKEEQKRATNSSTGPEPREQSGSDLQQTSFDSHASGLLGGQGKDSTENLKATNGAVSLSTASASANPESFALQSLNGLPSTLSGQLGRTSTALPAPPSSSMSRTESGGSRFLSLGTSSSQAISKEEQPAAASFDPPRQSRLLAFGSQNSKGSPQPNPQNAAAAAQLGRLQVEAMPPTLRNPSASPTIPVYSSQQSVIDKSRLQQMAINSLSDLQHGHGEEFSRRVAVEEGTFNAHNLDGGRLNSPSLLGLNRDFKAESMRSAPMTSANERTFYPQTDFFQPSDIRRHATPPISQFTLTSPVSPYEGQILSSQTSYSSGKGSRMAKHFEKQREPNAGTGRSVPGQSMDLNALNNRVDSHPQNNLPGSNRNIQDLLTMLNNSAQRATHGFDHGPVHQTPLPSSHISAGALSRLDSLSDPDEGRFAPDGLVPGLRPAAPPRRDVSNANHYSNPLDAMGLQRGNLEHMYPGQMQSQFNGQGMGMGRNANVSQQILRNGPSPLNNFAGAQGLPQQRLPPGLANLGGRPPHEPVQQFIGGGVGGLNNLPPQFHGSLPQHNGAGRSLNGLNGLQNLQNPNLAMLGNQGLARGQPGLGQLGAGLGEPNVLNVRNGPGSHMQNQMLGLGGPNLGQGMRGGPPFAGQQFQNANMAGMTSRQHQMQPQLMQQLLPQQLQGIPGGQPNPNDLIALLMGENRRD